MGQVAAKQKPAAKTDIFPLAVGEKTVKLLADQDRIVLGIRNGKKFEPDTRKLWAGWCSDGGTVIDVGVYDGLFSIGAALHGCRVVGFEPMPFNHERSLKNARLNGVKLTCLRAAASDTDGMTELVYNPKVPFTSGASLIRRKGYRLPVQTLRLDTVVFDQNSVWVPPGLGPVLTVTAIKIDVERAEPLVLRGARAVLERFRPKLIVESLGEEEQKKVLAELPDYRLADILDTRNLILLPL